MDQRASIGMLPIAEILEDTPPEYEADLTGHFKSAAFAVSSCFPCNHDKVITTLMPKWLFDSGSGLDVVRLSEVNDFLEYFFEAPKPLTVWAANGKTVATYQIRIIIAAFDEVITPYVLKDSPNLPSIGMRAEVQGGT